LPQNTTLLKGVGFTFFSTLPGRFGKYGA